ncbi:MAG TPA: hypothetical protein VGL03_12655 [Thermoanaerobaculia bacterium]|jgi:hypothetical protein
MRRAHRHLARILAGVALLAAGSPACFGRTPGSPRCAGPEHRQFDFWAGDWDAYDVDDPAKPSARVKVDVILDGCALREAYEGANGVVGQSFSIYDASRKVWHQTWVTNRGQLLVLEGGFRDGRMTLRATETTAEGPVLWRGMWIPKEDYVRETAETSQDGGKTWKPRFDILFRRHKQ